MARRAWPGSAAAADSAVESALPVTLREPSVMAAVVPVAVAVVQPVEMAQAQTESLACLAG